MPSQLNGKRAPGHRPASTALPPQRYGGRAALYGAASASAHQPLEALSLREGRRRRSVSPDTGQRAGRRRVPGSCRVCPRGSGRMPLAGPFIMQCQLEAPRLSPARCARSRVRVRHVVSILLFVTLLPLPSLRTARSTRSSSPPRASPSRSAAAAPTSSSSTARRSATPPPIRSRTCSAALPECRSSATAGLGQSSGFFIRGASTSGTVVLIDGVRVGSATLGQAEFEALKPGADRAHRGVARAGVEPLRCRRRRRRGTDLHASRCRCAAGVRRRRDRRLRLGARRRRRRAARRDLGTRAFAERREEPGVFRRARRAMRSALFNPDNDGFRREAGNAAFGLQPGARAPHRPDLLETRLRAQFDSTEFLPPTLRRTRRRTSATS